MQDVLVSLQKSFQPLGSATGAIEIAATEHIVRETLWADLRVTPAYAVVASTIVLGLTALAHAPAIKTRLEPWVFYPSAYEPVNRTDVPTCLAGRVKRHVAARGGSIIYAFLLLRPVGCIAPLGLAIAGVVLVGRPELRGWRLSLSYEGWVELVQVVEYAYVTLLSGLAIALGPVGRRVCSRHATLLLLVIFFVYAWRNVLPLTTYSGAPADNAIPWLLWTRGSLLLLVSIFVPLLKPRLYQPVDPSRPSEEVNPEQTASLLSFAFWTFLDPIIFTAYRQGKLLYDQLPALADYDASDYLAARSFDALEPLRRRERGMKDRHLFWGLMEVFRWDYIRMAALLVIRVFASYMGPIGVNGLLKHLERTEQVTIVRPWAWIILIALDPILGSICLHLYNFLATRALVQCESIITQLVFQHSLKIRLSDDSSLTPSSATPESVVRTPEPEGAVLAGELELDEDQHITRPETPATGSETVVASEPADRSQSPKLKGKAKSQPLAESDTKSKEPPSTSDVIGKINNLIGADLGNLLDGRDALFLVTQTPLQLIIGFWFLYILLDWAAVVGIVVMIASMPLPGRLAHWVQVNQIQRMKWIDARIQAITETMNVLRMVKMFGWEERIKEQIAEKREQELKYFRRRQIIHMLMINLNFVIPLITMIITYAVYSLVLGRDLNASTVFSSMIVFNLLRTQLHICMRMVPLVISARISFDRLNEFLNKTELLDRYTPEKSTGICVAAPDPKAMGFHNATFTWNAVERTSPGSGRRNFRLNIEHLIFKPNVINLICGPTGSGKTSILMALLGEMHFHPTGPDSWFQLPRTEGVAYAAQQSWVQNDTIRENILFGLPYDEERYQKVIYECALERDLALFSAGDQTEIGEKGLTLSGGQKARVTLARAIYSKAQILLLDDVLSALDVHTAKWIVDHCFRGTLVQRRTIVLVTHNIALVSPVARNIISLDVRGNVVNQGDIAEALSHDEHLREEMKKGNETLNKLDNPETLTVPPKEEQTRAGKLILEEEMAEGHLSWSALIAFLSGFGSIRWWFIIMSCSLFSMVFENVSTWWLGVWAAAYERHSEGGPAVDVSFYIGVYAAIIGSCVTVYVCNWTAYMYGVIRGVRKLHNQLLDAVLGTTLRWLDSTPAGRIISRFTQDMRQMDGPLPHLWSDLMELTFMVLAKFVAVVYFSPLFALPGILVTALGGWLGQVYITAQLAVKREMSIRRSPVYSHFGAAIDGIVSIRAYGAEDAFHRDLVERIDAYTRVATTFHNLTRWISLRIDVLGALFASALALYLTYGKSSVGASNTGFSLNMAVGLSGMILFWVRVFNDLEITGNSLERILEYTTIEQEPAATERGRPPAYWPSSGAIRAENLCARYSKDGPIVLHNLNFDIKSGERVAIVGRTGSGKSSLTLALLRMIPTTGVVYYDGLPTNEINLDALRSNLTIIPQNPELLSGTLRSNLDPFSQHDDHVLNDALRAAGLFRLQTEGTEEAITLDSTVTSGGSNFSVGQRQIIALARAIVRGAKVLILDEATASVDNDTDSAIQASIRSELKHATLITIAHRLHTIADYDKVMVLDAGNIVEFDSPINLLEKEDGFFRGLVAASGDREKLWEMARAAAIRA